MQDQSVIAENQVYDQDGLKSVHNHEFMADPLFQKAYVRGVRATNRNYQWHWRVHVGLWAAACASQLQGDFVECGVNRGFLSSAIMDYLNWDDENSLSAFGYELSDARSGCR